MYPLVVVNAPEELRCGRYAVVRVLGVCEQALESPASEEVDESDRKAVFFILQSAPLMALKSTEGTGYCQSDLLRILQLTGAVTLVLHHTPGWLAPSPPRLTGGV